MKVVAISQFVTVLCRKLFAKVSFSVSTGEIRAFTKFGSTLDDKIKLSQITLNNLIELHGAKFSKNQICPQPKIALFYILNARGIYFCVVALFVGFFCQEIHFLATCV